mmetsp:Transcript_8063/g.22904  ORF Transcript_8063/g.22904 Transcript_8063/m.22904 type:complete len:94 (-) Transcript_8063:301-582(-)
MYVSIQSTPHHKFPPHHTLMDDIYVHTHRQTHADSQTSTRSVCLSVCDRSCRLHISCVGHSQVCHAPYNGMECNEMEGRQREREREGSHELTD